MAEGNMGTDFQTSTLVRSRVLLSAPPTPRATSPTTRRWESAPYSLVKSDLTSSIQRCAIPHLSHKTAHYHRCAAMRRGRFALLSRLSSPPSKPSLDSPRTTIRRCLKPRLTLLRSRCCSHIALASPTTSSTRSSTVGTRNSLPAPRSPPPNPRRKQQDASRRVVQLPSQLPAWGRLDVRSWTRLRWPHRRACNRQGSWGAYARAHLRPA